MSLLFIFKISPTILFSDSYSVLVSIEYSKRILACSCRKILTYSYSDDNS
jgi:hypothetical protein